MPTFHEYPGALDRVLSSEPVLRAAEKVGKRGAAYGIRVAPFLTGRFALGIEVPEGGTGGGFHIVRVRRGQRIIIRLFNDTPYAYFLEHGTRYMTRRRTFGKILDHLKT